LDKLSELRGESIEKLAELTEIDDKMTTSMKYFHEQLTSLEEECRAVKLGEREVIRSQPFIYAKQLTDGHSKVGEFFADLTMVNDKKPKKKKVIKAKKVEKKTKKPVLLPDPTVIFNEDCTKNSVISEEISVTK
jgi:hypothetical protein